MNARYLRGGFCSSAAIPLSETLPPWQLTTTMRGGIVNGSILRYRSGPIGGGGMATEWYYRINGKDVGPVPPSALRQLANDGVVSHETPVRRARTQTGRPPNTFGGYSQKRHKRRWRSSLGNKPMVRERARAKWLSPLPPTSASVTPDCHRSQIASSPNNQRRFSTVAPRSDPFSRLTCRTDSTYRPFGFGWSLAVGRCSLSCLQFLPFALAVVGLLTQRSL